MKKTYLLVIMAAVMAICSCTKVEVIDVQGEVLAVKEVPVTAGTFQLPITVSGEEKLVWKARPVQDWLHVDDSEWKQNAYNVLVRYDSNESTATTRNFARVGQVVIETYDGFVADTIIVKQRGLTPSMKLSNVTVEASEVACEIPFNSNLTDACRPAMTFAANADWVESIEYMSNGTHLAVKFSANGAEERSANITVTFTDAWGVVSSTECVLTQKSFSEPEPEPTPEPEPEPEPEPTPEPTPEPEPSPEPEPAE
jgi:hypothetical protein